MLPAKAVSANLSGAYRVYFRVQRYVAACIMVSSVKSLYVDDPFFSRQGFRGVGVYSSDLGEWVFIPQKLLTVIRFPSRLGSLADGVYADSLSCGGLTAFTGFPRINIVRRTSATCVIGSLTVVHHCHHVSRGFTYVLRWASPGRTAMHRAAAKGREKALRLLLSKKVKVSSRAMYQPPLPAHKHPLVEVALCMTFCRSCAVSFCRPDDTFA